jgi:hypothetical protein
MVGGIPCRNREEACEGMDPPKLIVGDLAVDLLAPSQRYSTIEGEEVCRL